MRSRSYTGAGGTFPSPACEPAAARTKDSYFGAQYRQIARRRGPNKAAVAVAHSLLDVISHMLTTGEVFTDLGARSSPAPPGQGAPDPAPGQPAGETRLHRGARHHRVGAQAAKPSVRVSALARCRAPMHGRISPQIEHLLFSHITMNWRGRPLTSHEVVVQTIAATRTSSGLRVEATLDPGDYPTGVAISKERFAALPLEHHAVRGAWNYTLHPAAGAPPPARAPPVSGPAPPAAGRRCCASSTMSG